MMTRSARPRLIFGLGAVFFLIFFSWLAFHDSIWSDELHSLIQSRLDFPDLLALARLDMHPPGYPLLLGWWRALVGLSFPLARMLSVIAVFAAGLLLYVGGKAAGGSRAGVAAALLLWALPGAGFSALEIRMYGCSIAFLTLAAVSAHAILVASPSRIGWLGGLGIGMLGGMMMLNYAAPGLAVIALWLLVELWRERRIRTMLEVLIVLMVAALLYLPWLPSLLNQIRSVSGSFWAAPLTAKNAILIIDAPLMGYSFKFIQTLPAAAAVIVVAVCGLIALHRGGDRRKFRTVLWLLVAVWAPVLFGLGLSLISGRCMIIDRTVLPGCGLLAFALGLALEAPGVKRLIRSGAITIFALTFVGHAAGVVYRTRDGELPRLRAYLHGECSGDQLYYRDFHAASTGAGILPERRHLLLIAESQAPPVTALGNLAFVTSPPTSGESRRVFILSEESPAEFARAYRLGPLKLEKSFYSRYRFIRFDIYREVAPPSEQSP